MSSNQAQRQSLCEWLSEGQTEGFTDSPSITQHLRFSGIIFYPFIPLEEAQRKLKPVCVWMGPMDPACKEGCICEPQGHDWVLDVLLSKVESYKKVKKARALAGSRIA